MKRILFTLVIVVTSFTLQAQSIKGSIRDAQQQPLPFATILLLNAGDSSQVKGALSSEQGTYHFENVKAGNYLLSAQMMGYNKTYIAVQATGDLTKDLTLTAQNKQLQTVTVSASKPLVEQHADRTTFNVENSAVAAGNNAMELLRMAPLVTMDQNGGINLKGKAHVLVMVDGKIIPDETVGNILAALSAEQIVKIELITSPSAKYDASATGGIINIITKKGSGMGLNGTANLGTSQSSYGRYNGGLSLNYRNNKFNVFGTLSGRHSKSLRSEEITRDLHSGSDAVSMRTPTLLYGNGNVETGKVGIDYNLDTHSVLGVAVDAVFAQSNNRALSVNNFSDAAGTLDSTLTTNSHPGGHVVYTAYNLTYKNDLNKKGETLSADLTYTRYNDLTRQDLVTDMFNVITNTPGARITSATRTQANYNLLTFQADYSLPLSSATTLESGVKAVRTRSENNSTLAYASTQKNDSSTLSNTHYQENIFAGYVNVNQQWKKLKLQAGLRAEQTNATLSTGGVHNNYLDLFPGVSLEQHFSEAYQMGLSWSSRINRPSYESLIPFIIPIDTYSQEVGNSNLKPEYANSLDFTNTYKNISLTLNYTHTRDAITDFVVENAQTKVWSFTKSNFKKLESYSASLFVPINVVKWWSSNNTLVGIHSAYHADEIAGSVFNRGKFSYNLNSLNTFTLPGGFKAELTGNYNGAAVYGLYNISAYSQINAGVSKSFLANKLNVKLGMNDIFHDSGYKISMDAGSIKSYGYSMNDSRRVTMSVSYKFGKKIAPARERANSTETEQGRLNL